MHTHNFLSGHTIALQEMTFLSKQVLNAFLAHNTVVHCTTKEPHCFDKSDQLGWFSSVRGTKEYGYENTQFCCKYALHAI